MSSYVYFAGATLRLSTNDYPFTSISGTVVDPDVVTLTVGVSGQTSSTYTYTNGSGDPHEHHRPRWRGQVSRRPLDHRQGWRVERYLVRSALYRHRYHQDLSRVAGRNNGLSGRSLIALGLRRTEEAS